MLYCGDIWWLLIKKKRGGTLAAFNARLLLSIDSAVILYRPWLCGMMALTPVETIDQQVQNHSTSHDSRTFSGDWGKSGSAPPRKKKREARRHKPPERGKEIAIQQASDDCQFSSTADVMQTYAPLTLLSAMSFFSCSSSSSFPLYFPPSVFALLICSAALSLHLLPVFQLSPPLWNSLLSSLNPLNRDEWVEWSTVPWRLWCHPLFFRECVCVCLYVYMSSV